MQQLTLIEQFAHTTMDQIANPDLRLAHDFKHVDRVRRWALTIAHHEGFPERDLLEATALLHDIGLAFVQHRRDHAMVGAERAASFLTEHQLFPPDAIIRATDAIRSHSALSGGGLLGAILRDADMLDLFGAVGIMRACTSKYALPEYDPHQIKGDSWEWRAADFTERFQSGKGTGLYIVDQLNFQLSCADNLHTNAAKLAAQPLIAFMKTYLIQFENEIARNDLSRAALISS